MLGGAVVGVLSPGVGTLRFAVDRHGRLSEMTLSGFGGVFSVCGFPAGFAS